MSKIYFAECCTWARFTKLYKVLWWGILYCSSLLYSLCIRVNKVNNVLKQRKVTLLRKYLLLKAIKHVHYSLHPPKYPLIACHITLICHKTNWQIGMPCLKILGSLFFFNWISFCLCFSIQTIWSSHQIISWRDKWISLKPFFKAENANFFVNVFYRLIVDLSLKTFSKG